MYTYEPLKQLIFNQHARSFIAWKPESTRVIMTRAQWQLVQENPELRAPQLCAILIVRIFFCSSFPVMRIIAALTPNVRVLSQLHILTI